jgi:putative FmdB family regulatory protein
MPIYEYTCKDCGKSFEKLVRTMSDANGGRRGGIVCPECGSKNAARALSVFAAQGSSKRADDGPPPICGRCGGAPGSCQLD